MAAWPLVILQSMPLGVLVTMPEPAPVPSIVTEWLVGPWSLEHVLTATTTPTPAATRRIHRYAQEPSAD
ncbi:MAG: hypothetical protein ABI836_03270 [Gemmatimonadota bacterium]